MSEGRSAEVRLDGIRAGLLTETESGTRFVYDKEYLERSDAVPISLTLPLRAEAYETRYSPHPFFLNLLPEGWLLEITVARTKVSKDDPLGLLLTTCRDCVGAVEIMPL